MSGIWVGILASSKKISSTIIAQFLYGTSAGILYKIDSNSSSDIPNFNLQGGINDIKYNSTASFLLVSGTSGKLLKTNDLISWTTINTGAAGNITTINFFPEQSRYYVGESNA